MKPAGNVTFLFTDIEGSTKLSQEFPETLQSSLERHHSIMLQTIESNKGFVFEIIGDAFCCAFEKAEDAVKAAVEAQLNLAKEKWKEAVIKVRMGIHSGSAEWNGKGYMGYITLARTARVMSAAYGDQIIVSKDTHELFLEYFQNKGSNINLTDSRIQSDDLDMNPVSLWDYKDISFRNLGERRLKDVIQPIRLFQIVYPGLREDYPPLKTLDARPNNLPVQLTSFIGREEAIKDIKRMLSTSRLITIVGTGGAGKTRLSLQAGADMIDEFSNGVFLTELASVTDSSLIIQTVMNSLEIKEESGKSAEEILTGYLKDKELLLILDNCEHLINESSILAEMLLIKCPQLKIIATSREALNCAGEKIYSLSTLSHPDPSVNITPEQLTNYEAVRLFIERALSVNINFRVNNDNAPALAEICSRLEGIPLAIELAAARTKILSLEKIHERLDNIFSFLTGGKRTVLPRQQTLRAMIDWSYDLLSEEERTLWKRLSVFSGEWDLEAAEDVCSDEKIPEEHIFDYLNNLNEKSIISFDETKERFRMLETIRQYGEEKSEEVNEKRSVEERHLNYFLNFALTAETFLSGHDMQLWLDKLDCERGNFERSLHCAFNFSEIEKGLELASALGSFWKIRGHYSEGRQWLERFLEAGPDAPAKSTGKALTKLGKLVHLQGDIDSALKFLNKSVELSKDLNDKSAIGESLSNLGMIKFEQGDYEAGQKIYEETMNIYRQTGDKKKIAYALNDLGSLFLEKGEYDKAAEMFEECVELQRESGEKRGVAYSLFNLANIISERSDFKRCAEIYNECIVIFKELDEKRGTAYSLSSLANITLNLGEISSAIKLFDESIEIFRTLGEKRGLAFTLCSLATAAIQENDFEKASELIEESLSLSRETDSKPLIAYNLLTLGNSNYMQGNTEQAKSFFNESLEISTAIGHKPGIAYNQNYLGKIALKAGEIETAAGFFAESFKLNKELNQKKEIAVNLIGLAELKLANKNYEDAAMLLGFLINYADLLKLNIDKTDTEKIEFLSSKLKEIFNEAEYSVFLNKGKNFSLEEAAQLAINIV